MKKAYETPIVEKIEFEYTDTVTASNTATRAKQTYSVSNEWYTCNSSLVADNPCGFELSGGKQISNAYYDC